IRLSQPTDTVRVPVSRRPMVCGVVGGSQALATSSRVIPRARRTSRIRVIIADPPKIVTKLVFSLSYSFACVARGSVHPENRHGQGSTSTAASRTGDRSQRGAGAFGERPGGPPPGSLGDRQSGRIAARLAVRARLRHSQPI